MKYDSFLHGFEDELSKIAFDVEEGELDRGNESESESESEEPDTELKEPDEGAAGQFSGANARTALEGMLKSDEGRRTIRNVFDTFREQTNEIGQARQAFTRGLLRARRNAFGPSESPRSDLKHLLYRAP